MTKITAVLVITTYLLHATGSATAEPTSQGMQAFETGDYQQSAVLLKQQADAGDADAATLYARQLIEGLGVKENRTQAKIYLLKAAGLGSKEAQELYARNFGIGTDELSQTMLKGRVSTDAMPPQ